MKPNIACLYTVALMMGGMGMPSTRRQREIRLNENSHQGDILYWFKYIITPEEQLNIVYSEWKRHEKEDMHTFLTRRHIQRTVLNFIKRNPNDKNLKYKELVTK
jgi:hypothetical protein